MNTFEELAVRPEILRALAEKNITEPTPVQSEVIPVLLSGKDCVAQAPTGTGKTFAFGIPILESIDIENKSIQAVVMCPTRELAMQTETEMRAISKYIEGIRILAIFGGQSFDRQLSGLRKKPQIIIGTPGRVLDHLERRSLRIKNANVFVLDEADEMLDMGFRPDIDKILAEMPEVRHTLLFSATISPEIMEISKNYQENPVIVNTGCKGGEMPEIKQYVLRVKSTEKIKAFDYVMKTEGLNYVLVFTNTIRMVDTMVSALNKKGYKAEGLHGDLRQSQRDKVMRAFRSRDIQVLVATDVAARGIDISDIEAIFNYDVPLDNDFYVHRIGRTARAEKQGVSYTFVTTRDNGRIKEIEKVTGKKMEDYYIDGISDDKLSGKASDTKRIFVNLGEMDHITPDKMRDVICGSTSLKPSDIKQVDIMELFSFIEVSAPLAEQVVLLTNLKYMKRKVVFELAAGKGERISRRTGDKPNGEKRSYGDKPESSPRGERKPYERSERKPYDGERKPYEKSDRKPYEKTERKPYERSDKKPYDGEKKTYNKTDKKPFDGEKKAYAKPSKPYGERSADKPAKSYAKPSKPYGERRADKPARSYAKPSKPYGERSDDRPARSYDKPAKPYGERSDDRPARSYDKPAKPYGERSADKPATPRYKTKEERKTYAPHADAGNRPPRRNTDAKPYNKKRS